MSCARHMHTMFFSFTFTTSKQTIFIYNRRYLSWNRYGQLVSICNPFVWPGGKFNLTKCTREDSLVLFFAIYQEGQQSKMKEGKGRKNLATSVRTLFFNYYKCSMTEKYERWWIAKLKERPRESIDFTGKKLCGYRFLPPPQFNRQFKLHVGCKKEVLLLTLFCAYCANLLIRW